MSSMYPSAFNGPSRPQQPSQQQQQQQQQQQGHLQQANATTTSSNDTSRDEALARELQAQFNGETYVMAQPVAQPTPYSCGACSTTHAVRNAVHGSVFKCTVCGANNRIMLHQQPTMVVVDNPFPIPIFCSIM